MTDYLLAIDVGNTQTVFALYDNGVPGVSVEDGLVNHWRVSTDHDRTSDELATMIMGFRRCSLPGEHCFDNRSRVASAAPSFRVTPTRGYKVGTHVCDPHCAMGVYSSSVTRILEAPHVTEIVGIC